MDGEQEAGREAEVVEAPPSPLAERLRDFRDGTAEQPEEDKPAGGGDDDEAEGQDADEGDGTEADEQDGEQDTEEQDGGDAAGGDEDEAAGDEGEGDEPDPKAQGRTFNVEIHSNR